MRKRHDNGSFQKILCRPHTNFGGACGNPTRRTPNHQVSVQFSGVGRCGKSVTGEALDDRQAGSFIGGDEGKAHFTVAPAKDGQAGFHGNRVRREAQKVAAEGE
jgi:hypothetical protein